MTTASSATSASSSNPLAAFLRAERERRDLHRLEFAQMLGISPSHYNEIENGKKYPQAPAFARMMRKLLVPRAMAETFVITINGNNAASWGHRLRAYRYVAGLCARAAADRLDVTPVTLTRWENDRNLIDPDRLPQLAELYDVPLEELVKHYPQRRQAGGQPGPRRGTTHEQLAQWAAEYRALYERRKTYPKLIEAWGLPEKEVERRIRTLRRHGYLEHPGPGRA